MHRRQFLGWAGMGTIGALAGLGTSSVEASGRGKKRLDMEGDYSGTVSVDGSDVVFSFSIDSENRRTGKFQGEVTVFGSTVPMKGRISSGSTRLEFSGQHAGETLVFSGNILDRGKRITGTWKALDSSGNVVSQGVMTAELD